MSGPCILPFSTCPYQQNGECSDLKDAPFNSDSGCFKITGKKKMIRNARNKETEYIFLPLAVTVIRKVTIQGTFLRIFIGEKHLCTLRWMEPVAGGSPRWWIEDNQAVGTNELDAVENVLKIFGYKNDQG